MLDPVASCLLMCSAGWVLLVGERVAAAHTKSVTHFQCVHIDGSQTQGWCANVFACLRTCRDRCDVYMEQHTFLHLVSHLTPESYTWTRIHLPRPAESAREEMPGIAPSEALLPEARKHRINWDTSILGSQEVAGCLRYC